MDFRLVWLMRATSLSGVSRLLDLPIPYSKFLFIVMAPSMGIVEGFCFYFLMFGGFYSTKFDCSFFFV